MRRTQWRLYWGMIGLFGLIVALMHFTEAREPPIPDLVRVIVFLIAVVVGLQGILAIRQRRKP